MYDIFNVQHVVYRCNKEDGKPEKEYGCLKSFLVQGDKNNIHRIDKSDKRNDFECVEGMRKEPCRGEDHDTCKGN